MTHNGPGARRVVSAPAADWLAEVGLGPPVPWTTSDRSRALHDRFGVYPIGSSAPHTAGTIVDCAQEPGYANGKVGIVAHNLVASYRAALQKVDPEADIAVLPPVSGPSGQAGKQAQTGSGQGRESVSRGTLRAWISKT